MADNVLLNLGVGGDTIAADEVPALSGVKFPRCKITLGADGVDDADVSSSNPMPILFNPASAFAGTGQASVGTITPVQLTTTPALRGVIIKAMAGNSGKIYVGSNGSVTISNGFELIPGDAVCLPLNNLDLVWCVASDINQYVSWAVI
jgi:hypothetical protein